MPLVVAMMYEITNKDSFWRPYLDLLPETLDTPMFWNDDDLELLEGTSTLSHLGKEDAETIFTEQIVPFMKLHPTHFDLKVHNMALYHRVASVIMAYSFSEDDDEDDDDEDDDEEEDCCDGDANNECCSQKRQKRMEKIAMVPLADMLDHKTGCNNARLFYGKTTLAMSCIEPCAAGHELYNTYGDLSNSELLRKYGFIDDVNEHNSVDIPVEMLEERFESCSFMEEAMEALEEIGCWLPEFHIPADALPPQELEASIALLFQSPKQVRALRALDDEDEIRSFLATLVNKCRRKVSETLLAFGQKRAEEYTTTREEDEERLKESDLTHRQKMALRVRIGERTILHNYISHLKERLETTPPDQETKEPAPAHKNKKARKH
ncbi:hypothetical protein CAOG_000472 [Capsaspora owczarzaki ATCC 30864]|uniref:Rubisco LSMT substrate-binding domain-containing protein n=2 Tax=Capsaspora owczarzaki (strain ATCC 30864) TaxID=595528 RepID=A0A0D2VG98_CAPO3|nr:hypothetical protein CAOG_000472 [Capsaspora owczarzaki ATCC 30864]